MTRSSRLAAVAGSILCVVAVAACGGGPLRSGSGPGRAAAPGATTPQPVTPRTATPRPALPRTARPRPTRPEPTTTTTVRDPLVPSATIRWSWCGADEQCGTLAVPVDYSDPTGPTLDLSVIRHLAQVPSERIGSLVIDPGGPGDSGVNDLPSEISVLTNGLLARFDVVEFDPRGVDRSDPVTCPSSAADRAAPAPNDPVPQTAVQRSQLVAADRAYAGDCATGSGLTLLSNVGTLDAARDLEMLRAALGDSHLTYFGHSYGTYLGAEYADLYPDRVRALLLDGAIDPELSLLTESAQQAKAFETVLDSFFAWCAGSSSCPWRPVGDQAAALSQLTDQAGVDPLAAGGGRTVNAQTFYTGVLETLYSSASWPTLGRALAAAGSGDGAPLLALSTSYETHGGTNTADAQMAISCADHPVAVDPSIYPAAADAAAVEAPYFGPLFAWGALGCAVWPTRATGVARPVNDPGAPAALVTGTLGDPATPYPWAQALTSQLHGVLLSRTGSDHVAYYYSSCVRSYDEAYLVSLSLPVPGTVCS